MKPVNRTTLHTENSKRRGISPAVAAIILIVAAVVIGVLVVMYTMGLFKSTTTTPQIMVKDVVVRHTSSGCEVDITLQVLKGSISADSLAVYINSTSTALSLEQTIPASAKSAPITAPETVTLVYTTSQTCNVGSPQYVMIYYKGQPIYHSTVVPTGG